MPALSPTMTTGNFVKWYVKEGDEIKSGDVLAEIETDKATMKWDSVDDGYIAKIFIEDGTADVAVKTPVAILVEDEESVAAFANYSAGNATSSEPPKQKAAPKETSEPKKAPEPPKQQEPSKPAEPFKSSPKAPGDRLFVSPAARVLAKEKGYDLSQIQGTGPEGRIVLADVKEFTPSRQTTRASVASVVDTADNEFTDIPHTNIRRVTATRLTESKQQIPHYYLSVEFCVDELLRVREGLNNRGKGNYKLSVNDFVIKASAMALRKVPEVNSIWNDKFIRRYHNVNINVAVNTDAGLYTPLVPNTDNKGLVDISNSVRELAGKAQKSQLSLDDLQIGTFTISNLGMFGIKNFSAVINPPQAAILAVGGIEKRVVPNENALPGEQPFKVSSFMSCTLSCDHRVIDGALGAAWLKEFKTRMEEPLTLLL